jgi:hypothetical protein
MLAGIVIRCLSLIFDSPELKYLIWSFGFFLIVIIWTQKDVILANFLNNVLVQSFLFLGLRAEDIIYSYKGYEGYLAAAVFACSIGHTPAIILFICFGANPFIWYWFLMIVLATYLRLRNLFIFPTLTHVTTIEDPNYNPYIDHPDKFTWNLVVQNADTVLFKLHGRSVINQLSPNVGNFPLRYAGIRYMSGTSKGYQAIKLLGDTFAEYAVQNPKKAAVGVLAFLGLGGSLVGGQIVLESRKLDSQERELVMKENDNFVNQTHKHIESLQEQRANLKPGDPLIAQLDKNTNELNNLLTQRLKENSGLPPTVYGLPGNPYPSDQLQGALGAKLPKNNNDIVKATSFYEESGIFCNIINKVDFIIQALFF